MEQTKTRLTKGLTSYQIKMLAVIFMTIDHLGAYGFEIPVFDAYNTRLRLIGRIAMPLFLFCLTDSIRYTRSRPKFLLRLYLAAVGTGLFTSVTNYFFGDSIGHFILSNIFYTYFYVALYSILIEAIIASVKELDWKKGLLSAAGIGGTVGIHYIYLFLMDIDFMGHGLSLEHTMLIKELIQSVIESPWLVEYTFLFVIMGVAMYFAWNKYAKAAVLVAFSALCYIGGRIPWGSALGALWERILFSTPLFTVMGSPQCYMALAAPIMLLYNGQKGRGSKYFFYLYFPLHRYAISIMAYLYLLFFAV